MNVVSRLAGRLLYGNSVADPNYDIKMNAAEVTRFGPSDGLVFQVNSDSWTSGADLSGIVVDQPKISGFFAFCIAICLSVTVFATSVLLTPIDHLPFTLPASVAAYLSK